MNSWPTHLKYLYTANQKTKDKIKELQRWTNKRFKYAYSNQNYKILLMCFLKENKKLNPEFNYETLEWIGDSLIAFLVVIHIFRKIPFETNLTPDFEEIDRKQKNLYLTEGHYSELKQILTENDTFCRFMTVGNTDFQCKKLFAYFTNLLNKHELFNSNKENYDVTESVNYCEKSFSNMSKPSTLRKEKTMITGSGKQFADIFEAIVAAIYLDLNCNLDKLYEYFEPIIDQIVQQTIEHVKKCSHKEFIDKNDSSKERESRGRDKQERLLQNLKRLIQ